MPQFRLLVVDHERRLFAITHWMDDDTAMNERVVAEQDRRVAGKRPVIKCQTIPAEYTSDEEIIREAERLNPGYRHAQSPLV